MLVCVKKSKELTTSVPLIPKSHQPRIRRFLSVHRGMIVFFLLGYVVVLISFIFDFAMISELFVGIIFLIGAIFVLTSLTAQTYLLSEIQSTFQGLLPICSVCKKIRIDDANPKDSKSWTRIEEYISKKSNVDFSHGYCPECFELVMSKLTNQRIDGK